MEYMRMKENKLWNSQITKRQDMVNHPPHYNNRNRMY